MAAHRLAPSLLFLAVAGTTSLAEAGRPVRTALAARPTPAARVGVKSDEAVHAAIARTADGGTAVLPQGAFRTSLRIERPMTLRAHARGTTLDGKGLSTPVIEVAPGVRGVVLEGLRVQNGARDGVLVRAGATEVVLDRVVVVRCAGDGLRIEAGAGVRVERCVLEENGGDGLEGAGPGVFAARVTAIRNGAAGVRLVGDGALLEDGTFVGGGTGLVFEGNGARARRCRFVGLALAVRFADGSHGNHLGGADARGVGTFVECEPGSAEAGVTDCVVTSVSGDAFRLEGDGHQAVANEVEDVRGDGFVVTGRGTTLRENALRDARGAGIRLVGDDHVVDANVVRDADEEGIQVASGRGVRVTNNTVRGCAGRGIADDGEATLLAGNRIE